MPTETSGNEDEMNRLGILLLLAALLSGCTSRTPVATPTSVPTPPSIAAPTVAPTSVPNPTTAPGTAVATAPIQSPAVGSTPTAIPIEQADIRCEPSDGVDDAAPEVGEVIEQLGFAIQPSELPAGFKLAGVSHSNNEVRQIYQMDHKNIILAYPIEFSPDSASDPLGWERPLDAVNGVQIGDQMAYFMVGGWSDASIIAGPALRPDRAEWDYEKSVALFFTCRVGGGRDIDMAIQVLPGPIDWIDASEIVNIAHSLKRLSRSR